MIRTGLAVAWLVASLAMFAAPAAAQPIIELRYLCYQNGEECEISRDLLERFNRDNPDVRVAVDIVSFNVVREQLETRLTTGQGPDMARVTNLGGFHRFYLDLSPYIDAPAWERAFGPTLDWLRAGPGDRGVYGFMTQLTVSGPIVNRSLFERARVPLPGEGASWDDWAEAIAEVKRRTGVYSGIALDRSGHRFAGPAISYGARFLGEDGRPVLPPEPGVRAFADRMVRWHREGLMPPDLWPSATGARLRNGDDMFINGDVVMHYGGSWQIQRFAEEIGERFEWVVAPSPCGPAACTGMPGGAAMVAFRHTRHPSAVARVMSYMASEPALREFYGRALQIPAHRGLAGAIEYPPETPRLARAALAAFAANYAAVAPEAHRLQSYSRNHIVFNAIAEHVTSVIAGRATMEDALTRIEAEIRRGTR